MKIDKNTDFLEGQLLLFDKPMYWTSFDLVKKVKNIIRNTFGYKKIKVGHAGTLDPLASGLMIICTGKYTRQISALQESSKEYIADIRLGETTPSFDLETVIDGKYETGHITRDLVLKALAHFGGENEQIPPVFSAKNIKGKRAYDYARKGIDIEMKARKVIFHELELLNFELPIVTVRILCSKGTYVRAFARDMGNYLDSGAYLSELKRTSIGEYKLEDAMQVNEFERLLNSLYDT
ncbi:MAG TPA: tRNA pseudouridine(55) synthase TruB [Bacteroidetes bacterium]|nr:tRNA pseudouridine(55) synthase TruB [Bacteroidota bacterium]